MSEKGEKMRKNPESSSNSVLLRKNRQNAAGIVELLESRILLSADLGMPAEPQGDLFASQKPALVTSLNTGATARRPADGAGNTRAAAHDLGTLTAAQSFTDFVGRLDRNDYYRFKISNPSGFQLSLTGLSADADVSLLNVRGAMIASSANYGTQGELISGSLQPGTYYVRVYPYRGDTTYTLDLHATPAVPTSTVGNALATAENLGELTRPQTLEGSVGRSNRNHYYRFNISSSKDLSLALTGLSADADVSLLDANGHLISRSQNYGRADEFIATALTPGTYYVRVYYYSGMTNYTLTLDAREVQPAAPDTTPAGAAGYHIELTFSGVTSSQQRIFEQAASRLEQIVTGDLPNVLSAGRVIDDVLISISAEGIDGVGRILGQSSATRFRSGSDLPYQGFSEFDSADLASMQANGTLLSVAEHEMLHVMGFGIIWSELGLLSGASTSNPRFTGPNATAAYNRIFGLSGSSVPVEASGGSGTRLSHWRESTFNTELMTGWLNGTTSPLSQITVASLADLGYQVNMSAVDTYTSARSALAGSGAQVTSANSQAANAEPLRPALRATDLNAAQLTAAVDLLDLAPLAPWLRRL